MYIEVTYLLPEVTCLYSGTTHLYIKVTYLRPGVTYLYSGVTYLYTRVSTELGLLVLSLGLQPQPHQ